MKQRNTCSQCRYWSERMEQTDAGAFKSWCLCAGAPLKNRWRMASDNCPMWAADIYGAVDDPGFDPAYLAKMYSKYDVKQIKEGRL